MKKLSDNPGLKMAAKAARKDLDWALKLLNKGTKMTTRKTKNAKSAPKKETSTKTVYFGFSFDSFGTPQFETEFYTKPTNKEAHGVDLLIPVKYKAHFRSPIITSEIKIGE